MHAIPGLGPAIVKRPCDRYAIDLRIDSVDDMAIASIAIEPAGIS